MPKIVKHNNVWCIQDSFPLYDKPEMIIQHWPIGTIFPPIGIDSYEGHEVTKNSAYGYSIRTAPYQHSSIHLKDQGQTKSIHTYTVMIPCPKVRKGIVTRWYNGQWEKLLKSGWTLA